MSEWIRIRRVRDGWLVETEDQADVYRDQIDAEIAAQRIIEKRIFPDSLNDPLKEMGFE